MAVRPTEHRLIDRLPAVRGDYVQDQSLARLAWFRVGGPAEVVFSPADQDDLARFLRECPPDVPRTVIGVASNLLIRDGGVDGVVIRLGRVFADIRAEGDGISAGAGAMDVNVAFAARDRGLAGLEFLRGIPGTIGGALRMNAGAYGREIKDVLVHACALDAAGRRHELGPAEMELGYRHCAVPEDWIFVEARLRGRPDDRALVTERMDEIRSAREESQPTKARTGGSTFTNPPGATAWELIEAAGCRGLRRGGAMVSEKHCNFLINTGDATAADLERLGEEVRRRVLAETGVELSWEIRRIGRHADAPLAEARR